MPRLRLATLQRVDVIVGTPCLFLVHESFVVQRLARSQFQTLTRLALDGNLRIARQVLTHIEHQQRVALLFHDLLDRESLHDFHWVGYLGAQLSLGRLLNDYRMPVFDLKTGIIILTTIEAVEGDGR